MRTISTVCFLVIFLVDYCSAQMSVNPDWRERNGLTVASSQTIVVPAKILRGFVTLESVAVEPRNDEATGKNPLSHFSPGESEVFGNDASKLSRTFSVELRFNIE